MGLTSTTTVTASIQICVFDLRRGQLEGQEIDKILFFYPSDCPYSTQLSVIGLSEGLITFTRLFSPDADCEVIETEKHSYVFYQAEPDVWMVMVIEKSKDSDAVWRSTATQALLIEVHNLFVMFHGSIRGLLDKQPSGLAARSHLHFFISDYLNDFLVAKKFQIPSFRDCLKEKRTVQILTIDRDLAIEVQSLVTDLEYCGGSAMCRSLILFHNLLVSSTLSPVDTTNLFTYAVMRLTPQALSSSTNWSYLRKGTSASNILAASMMANTGYITEAAQFVPYDTIRTRQNQVSPVIRPLQRENWIKGKDGFLVNDMWREEAGSSVSSLPIVLLRQPEEWMYICVYQVKSLTIILLIPTCSLVNKEQGLVSVRQQILENAHEKIQKVEQRLVQGWGGENAYHVSGYRYLLLESDQNISRASPPGKVLTLTKDSLLLLNKLREEVDLEKSRARADDTEHEKDLEVCIRAKGNTWVIARVVRGKELYMVLEKANETLMYASDAVDKFSSRYCDGAFSLD